MTIEEIKQKHEELKKKALALNETDLFDWLELWDNIIDIYINKKSEYQEKKINLKIEKWKRKIELKSQKDNKWNKIHTEKTSDALIDEEFQEKDIKQAILENEIALLNETKNIINEYILLWKKIVFRD